MRTKDLIKYEKILVKMFNKHYINIAEETPGIAPKNLGNPLGPKLDERTIREIIENYRNHHHEKKKTGSVCLKYFYQEYLKDPS